MAEAGIYKWHIDIQAGTCTYIDLKEQAIISRINTSVIYIYSNILIII